jgi:DNA-binding GntR family transcriptional regulator
MRQPQPPYLRIAADIRAKIEHGELRPGEQVSSVTELATQYEVSRATARRALDVLKDEGLTEGVPGWGTFTRPESEWKKNQES